MAFQYSDYCYATVNDAAASIFAEPLIFDDIINKAMMVPTSFTVSANNAIFTYKPNGTGTAVTVTRFFPTCSTVGPIKVNTSPLDAGTAVGAFTAGASIVFPAFAIIWAAAFVLKHLNKI